MKKSVVIFLLIQLGFALSGTIHLEASALGQEAKLFVQQLFVTDLDDAEIVESATLPYFAFTSPLENKIWVRPELRQIQRKINLVHEYTHRLRFKKNIKDEIWFAEGLSQIAEYLYTIWPTSYDKFLAKKAEIKISRKQSHYLAGARAYADSFYLMYYLYSHFGGRPLLLKMMQSPLTGWENILSAIAELQAQKIIPYQGLTIDRAYILRHFAVALVLNNAFIADYSLFHLHDAYAPLKDQDFLAGGFESSPDYDFQIVFSKNSNVIGANSDDLVYSIVNTKPFEIQRGVLQTAKYYIFIRQ